MVNALSIGEIEHYVNEIIPRIEKELGEVEDKRRMVELYNLYEDVLCLVAKYDFRVFNKYLELDDDMSNPQRGFYYHRKEAMGEIFDALNDMELYDKYDMVLISTPPRTGKALHVDSKLLTPNGWIRNGDVKIGQKLIGSDGKSITVTGVFPQGVKELYEVVFDDGTIVKASADHLWTVRTRDDRRRGSVRTVTTKSMIHNLMVEKGKRSNYSIDYVEPVEFENSLKDGDLHPYVLGVLIGDGGLSEKSSTRLTSIDGEIVNRVERLLPKSDKFTIVDNMTYAIVKKDTSERTEGGHAKPSTTLKILRELGLGESHSNDKFIPKKYLYSSVENRVELLRGLMDTDGYAGDSRNTYNEYSTVSPQLANDFIEFVRSLGARATLNTKTGSYIKNGERVMCQKVYRITFNMEINPFYLKRKRDDFLPRVTRTQKYIKEIRKVEDGECLCISVDADDRLYVTDGYNLTHNTTLSIRFLSWIAGKYPENTQMGVSYSDAVTQSFYNGVMEIVQGERFHKVFPDAPLINQNAKREEIWLKVQKRYPSLLFVPVGGSMTGRGESGNYLYCDDLVSGIEEALSIPRLNKLWELYTTNIKQRKKKGAKEIHVATRWSVHDPITKLDREFGDNPRVKVIKLPCYDEDGESKFDFPGGFDTEYYKDIEKTMDKLNFGALYMCNPIEREGLLYHEEDMQYYFNLPKEPYDSIIAICDSKNMGKDNVASPIGYVYGDFIYIEDVVYNNGLPEVTRPLVANKWMQHKVVRADVEMNNGGNYYAEDLAKLIADGGGKTSIRTFYSGNNKDVKIITYSDYVKKYFVFKDKSQYSPNSEYARFMQDVFSWTQTGNNKFDDAPDSLAMLANLHQDMTNNSVKILNRKELRI